MLRWGGGQHSFVFPETQFITVTAYQNNKVPQYCIYIPVTMTITDSVKCKCKIRKIRAKTRSREKVNQT